MEEKNLYNKAIEHLEQLDEAGEEMRKDPYNSLEILLSFMKVRTKSKKGEILEYKIPIKAATKAILDYMEER
tara:strand:+ start:696 stop:911 length:216 start_codon:yes stop_codon:yes gene_type:complete